MKLTLLEQSKIKMVYSDYHNDLIHAAEALAILELLINGEQECPECGELTNDTRGDWCKDCDKQGGAN